VTDETDWSIEDGAGGEFQDNGWYESENASTWNVTGQWYDYRYDEYWKDTTILTIEPAEVDRVEISPDEDFNYTAGDDPVNFTAGAEDEYANLITDDPLEFDWENTDKWGVFDENRIGEYEVTATYGDVTSDPTTVRVYGTDPIDFWIEPQEHTTTAGQSVEYIAYAEDEYENIFDVTENTEWSIEEEPDDDEAWIDENVITVNKTDDEEIIGEWTIVGDYMEDEDTYDTATLYVEPAELNSVEILPSGYEYPVDELEIVAGVNLTIDARALDKYGNEIPTDTDDFEWENKKIERGVFFSREVGDYEITATYENITSDPIIVTVVPADPEYIEISPKDSAIIAGENQSFTATAYDEYGNAFEVTEDTEWYIEEDNHGGIFDNNTYESKNPGNWTVNASYEYEGEYYNRSTSLYVGKPDWIEILPKNHLISAGESVEYTAIAHNETLQEKRDVTEKTMWYIWDHDHGEFWEDNIYTPEIAGEWTVNASYEYQKEYYNESTSLKVEVGEVYVIEIDPEEDQTITAGERINFTARAFDEYGNLITDDVVDFEWENISRVNETENLAIFNETKMGEYTVNATYVDIFFDDKQVSSKDVTVTVEAAEVEMVKIDTEFETNITAGEKINFTAEALDEYGNVVENEVREFTWENIGELNENATFDITDSGEYDVTATYDNVTSEPIKVTVEAGEVDYILLDPEHYRRIRAGETIDFSAEAFDEYDNLIEDDDSEFTWENTDETGFFNETEVGEYHVTASYENVTSEVTIVNVEAAETDYVIIHPDDQTLEAGETIDFSAEAFDEYDNLIEDDDAEFTWENTDETGLFDETEVGEYEVTASYENVTSEVIIVTVEPAETDYVIIHPDEDQTLEAGETIDFSAEAFDEYDNLIEDDDLEFTWENTDETGLFDETEVGEYEVTASYEGVTSEPTTVRVVDEFNNLIISIEGEGFTDPEEGTHKYEEGTDVTVTATPSEGWRFVEWQGDHPEDESDEREITITMDEDKSLTAVFDEVMVEGPYFEIEIIDYDDEVEEGETVTVRYEVKNIGGERGTQNITFSVDGNPIDTHTNITLETSDSETNEFTWEAEEEGEYELEVASEDTSDSVTVTVEEEDWLDWFCNLWWLWLILLVIWLILLVIILALIFYFWKRTLTIEEIEGEGKVYVNREEVTELPHESDYTKGSEVELLGEPDEGWEFVRWTGVPEEKEEDLNILLEMDSDKTVTAIFESVEELEEEEVETEVILDDLEKTLEEVDEETEDVSFVCPVCDAELEEVVDECPECGTSFVEEEEEDGEGEEEEIDAEEESESEEQRGEKVPEWEEPPEREEKTGFSKRLSGIADSIRSGLASIVSFFGNKSGKEPEFSKEETTTEEVEEKGICPNCRALVPSDSEECPECGEELESTEEETLEEEEAIGVEDENVFVELEEKLEEAEEEIEAEVSVCPVCDEELEEDVDECPECGTSFVIEEELEGKEEEELEQEESESGEEEEDEESELEEEEELEEDEEETW